jgi:tetratricopeptide (TPR) repeat protein
LISNHRREEAGEFIQKGILHAKLTEDAGTLANSHYYLAVMQARIGEWAGYRETCQALIELSLSGVDDLTKSRRVWTPSLAPDALDDLGPHVKRAEDYHDNCAQIDHHFRLYVLGAAYYRAGQYDQAAQRLEESIAAFPTRTSPVTDSLNYHKLFLAMTQWHLGAADEARRLLEETLPEVDKELKSPASGWNRRATLELLRGEAEALIQDKEAKEIVENGDHHQPAPTTNSPQNPSRE